MTDVERLGKLLAEGTPGPWVAHPDVDGGRTIFVPDVGRVVQAAEPLGYDTGCDLVPSVEDAALIVEGINALPDLLATIVRQAEEIARLTQQSDQWRRDFEEANAAVGQYIHQAAALTERAQAAEAQASRLTEELATARANGFAECRKAVL